MLKPMLDFVALLALAALGEDQEQPEAWFDAHTRWSDPKVSRAPFIEAGPVEDPGNPRGAFVCVLLPGGHFGNRYTRQGQLSLF